MPESYIVSYEYQGKEEEERVYTENAALAVIKVHDSIVTPLFKHTFKLNEVKKAYETTGQ